MRNLTDLAEQNVISEQEKEALLKIPAVRTAVGHAVMFDFGIMTTNLLNFADVGFRISKSYPPREFAKAFVNQLFPYFQTHPELALKEKPVIALERFWDYTISRLAGGQEGPIGDLERAYLARESGAPAIFLGRILAKTAKRHNDELSITYFNPIYIEMRDNNFNEKIAEDW